MCVCTVLSECMSLNGQQIFGCYTFGAHVRGLKGQHRKLGSEATDKCPSVILNLEMYLSFVKFS